MEGLVFPAVAGLDFNTLPQQLVNGLLLGAIYALIALGYTMVYGVLRLINFAHGEVFMLGAYTALFTSWSMGFNQENLAQNPDLQSSPFILILMMLISMLVCGVIGIIIEYFAYRPMRNQSRIAALITAIGVSLLLQFGGQLFLPAEPPPSINEKVNPYQTSYQINLKPAPKELTIQLEEATALMKEKREAFEIVKKEEGGEFNLSEEGQRIKQEMFDAEAATRDIQGQVTVQSVTLNLPQGRLIMFCTVIVLMIGLWWLVMFTNTGRAMRAASHDFDSASLMGVNVNRVVSITFLIGSSLAGAGAMMNATFIGTPLTPFYGLLPGVKAFVAAVLGGIGNIPGAVLGGFVMGISEELVVWAGYSSFKDAIAFIILIVVLLFRPGGILGSSKVEKV